VLNGDYKVSLQYQEISSINLLQVEDNFETSSKLPDDCFFLMRLVTTLVKLYLMNLRLDIEIIEVIEELG
jgi:hypothetical protein